MIAFATSARFAVLEPADRDRLEALARLDQFEAGEVIAVGGEPAEWLRLIVDGAVELRAPRRTLLTLGPGALLGELDSFCELPAGVRQVAREKTIVRAVPKAPLLHELKAHRQLASRLLAVYCRSISEKIRATNEVAAKLAAGVSRPPPPAGASGGRPPHLDEAEQAWLAVLGQRVEVASGEAVIREGDATRSFYVVERGELEVRKQAGPGKPEHVLAHLGPRDLFGIMALVDGQPRSASVVATTAAYVTKVEPEMLDKATHLNFTVSFRFLGTLCGVLGRIYRDTVEILANAP